LDRAATAGSDQTEAAGFTAVEASISRVLAALPGLLGFPDARVGGGVFRWCHTLQEWPDAGEWIDPGDGRVPEWLRPFNGEVLVAWDRHGHYAAGVGRKIHDRHGQEISVGTEAANRGRGLARHLVAQAARRIAEEGAVATYLHRTDNPASARVADVSGFPDEGWKVIGLPAAS
jgi:GNAT superfamily N-acetyltransferase